MDDITRERVLDLLVDEHLAAARARGDAIRNIPGWRAADREACKRQERDNPGWLQLQADRLLGEVARPPAWTDPDDELVGVTFADWLDAGAPEYPDGPDHARYLHATVYRLGNADTPADQAAAAIDAHPWPRPPDRYLEHDPSPGVALAIAVDLLARVNATRAGRDPELAMRQGWDARRAAPIDADDTRL